MAGAMLMVISMLLSAPNAVAQSTAVEFNIPAQPISSALRAYAHQAKVQLLVLTEDLNTTQANAVVGQLDPQTALQMLLAGTGIHAEYRSDATVAVKRGADSAGPVSSASGDAGDGRASWLDRVRQKPAEAVMMAQAMADETPTSHRTRKYSRKDRRWEEIIVTGTRIKGIKDQFSPVTQISREEMDLAGFNNVSDVVESIPQNFGGGVTIDTSQANSTEGPGNASINLRGLGNHATLILLNGRRLAAGGSLGQFVDISTIPASAIDRVEVMVDGASAIYGSDAIAGVVNIILREDFDGAETRLNVGTITDGGGDYLKAGQTLGWNGDRARALVTYEYSVEDELDSNDKDFAENATEPTWLLPDTEKHSVFISTGAQLTDQVELSADAYFNDRKSKQFTSSDLTTSFFQAFQRTDVQQYGGAFGLNIALFDDWETKFSGNYSRSDHFTDLIRATDLGELDSAVTEVLSFDATIGGSLFSIHNESIKGVAGIHHRSEDVNLLRFFKGTEFIQNKVVKSRDIFAAFGEFYAPIISDGNRRPGVENLALSAAVRYENYDDVGSSFDPKVGIAWSPINGLNLRATYSTSFRAPRLDQLRDNVSTVSLGLYVDPIAPDGESVALLIQGQRDDLDPEASRTWTAGFDYTPRFLDGFLVRGTFFNTEFRDQVGLASFSFDSDLRFMNFTGIPVRDPSQETVLDLCERAGARCFNFADFFPQFAGLTFEDVEIILDRRVQNLSQSKVTGIDFEGSYDLSSAAVGDWRFFVGGTLLMTFEQQVAPAAAVDDLLNTYANPVDLKLRGGVQWRTESMSSAIYVNHIGDYVDDEVSEAPVPIHSFTTLDATLRIDLSKYGNNSLTDGTFLTFSVLNVLNEDPPRITPALFRRDTFDAVNASPAGRRIGLLLTKRW